MSKSILIIDAPSACIDCPCHFVEYYDSSVFCGAMDKELVTDDIETFKPDWCPLKEIPQKKSEQRQLEYRNCMGSMTAYGREIDNYAIGYNACIDEMLQNDD